MSSRLTDHVIPLSIKRSTTTAVSSVDHTQASRSALATEWMQEIPSVPLPMYSRLTDHNVIPVSIRRSTATVDQTLAAEWMHETHSVLLPILCRVD